MSNEYHILTGNGRPSSCRILVGAFVRIPFRKHSGGGGTKLLLSMYFIYVYARYYNGNPLHKQSQRCQLLGKQ